jgi:VWFA-related protein
LAQQTTPPPQDLVKLTTRSDLVLVPVIVTDKSGNHVPGLTKDSFRIEENGKLRSISIFEELHTEAPTIPASAQNPGTYSNFLLGDDHPWRITIVVLDMLNTPWLRQIEGKKQLIDYLSRSAVRNEPTAVFGLNSRGLHQLHPFTTNTQVLLDALQKLKLSLSTEERTQPPATLTDDPTEDQQASDEALLMSDFMQDLDTTITANYQRTAIRETLAALTQLSSAFQSIPGRKTLIWASAGFPFTIDDPQSFARQGDDLRPEYEQAWRSLDSANIAVYPVDLGSVDFTPGALPSANATTSTRQINNIRGNNGLKSALNLPYDQGVQQRLTLHAFADSTGGRACITIAEIDKCFAAAVDDSRSYYLLGYYLGADTQPGWRKLKVKVSGDSLHIRYRTGFYIAPKLDDTPELRRQQIVDALASPVPYTGLRLTARIVPPDNTAPPAFTSGQKKSAEFILGVMGDSVTMDSAKGNAVDLQLAALAFDTNRKAVASTSQALATTFKPEMAQKIRQTGLGIPQKLDLPPGKYEIKFAVRDNLTGLLGTISLPLELK